VGKIGSAGGVATAGAGVKLMAEKSGFEGVPGAGDVANGEAGAAAGDGAGAIAGSD
jgi:hypothetical protein